MELWIGDVGAEHVSYNGIEITPSSSSALNTSSVTSMSPSAVYVLEAYADEFAVLSGELTVTPAEHFSGPMYVEIVAIAHEKDIHSEGVVPQAMTVEGVDITVRGVADAPQLDVEGVGMLIMEDDEPAEVHISKVALVDADLSEELTVEVRCEEFTISGIMYDGIMVDHSERTELNRNQQVFPAAAWLRRVAAPLTCIQWMTSQVEWSSR